MRIINVLPHPQHFSYASTSPGGRTLKPGQSSSEVSLHTIHGEQLQRDLDSGKIQLRLSDADVKFMKQMLDEAKKPIKKQKLPVKKPKPKVAPKPPPKPNLPPQSLRPDPPPKSSEPVKPIERDDIDKGEVNLADLQKHNTAIKTRGTGVPTTPTQKASLSEIETHIGGLT